MEQGRYCQTDFLLLGHLFPHYLSKRNKLILEFFSSVPLAVLDGRLLQCPAVQGIWEAIRKPGDSLPRCQVPRPPGYSIPSFHFLSLYMFKCVLCPVIFSCNKEDHDYCALDSWQSPLGLF